MHAQAHELSALVMGTFVRVSSGIRPGYSLSDIDRLRASRASLTHVKHMKMGLMRRVTSAVCLQERSRIAKLEAQFAAILVTQTTRSDVLR
jgi:hypothetical protein